MSKTVSPFFHSFRRSTCLLIFFVLCCLGGFPLGYSLIVPNAIAKTSFAMSMSAQSSSNEDGFSSVEPKKVAVIGATGKLGRRVVQRRVSDSVPVRCLIRQDTPPAFLANLSGIEFVKGDVTDRDSVTELLKDCKACLAVYGAKRISKLSDILPWTNPSDTDPSHAKRVNYLGVQNLIDAASLQGCKRIVRITGKGETPFSIFSILINTMGSFAKAWNYEGEQLLRNQSKVEYTIIRPGVMKEGDPDDTSKPALLLGDNGGNDLKVAPIRYEDIADLCVDCLDYPNAARSTLMAVTASDDDDAKNAQSSFRPLLKSIQPDSRQFPTSLMKENKQAVRLGTAILLSIGALGATAAFTLASKIIGLVVSKFNS